MNTFLRNFLILAIHSTLFTTAHTILAKGTNTKANHNVRIMHNQDGSFTEFRKSANQRVIERRNYSERKNGERVLRMSIIYRKDVYGRLRSGRIYDGSGQILYRVVYAYNRKTGKIAQENMYDARVKRTTQVRNPETGKTKVVEKPVRQLYHTYDEEGRPGKPIVFCLPPGKRADELFGPNGSSYLRNDPWK